jgi:hypothetical protein
VGRTTRPGGKIPISGSSCIGNELDFRIRGRMQDYNRRPSKTLRHVLDGPRSQQHHRSSLLPPQRQLRGLLGAPAGLILHFYVAHPSCIGQFSAPPRGTIMGRCSPPTLRPAPAATHSWRTLETAHEASVMEKTPESLVLGLALTVRGPVCHPGFSYRFRIYSTEVKSPHRGSEAIGASVSGERFHFLTGAPSDTATATTESAHP